MRYRTVFVILLLLLLFPIVGYGEVPDQGLTDDIEELASTLTDGDAMLVHKTTTVTYTVLPTFSSGRQKAAVVLFTMEGYGYGNDYRQFLAVFFRNPKFSASKDSPHHDWRLSAITVVGHDFQRIFDSAAVNGTNIMLTGKKWESGDSHSHPTGMVHAVYKFAPYTLIEVN